MVFVSFINVLWEVIIGAKASSNHSSNCLPEVVVCLPEVVAYYSGCSSNHSSNCFDYSSYLSNPGLDSNFGSSTCSSRYYLHTTPVVVGFVDSHTVLALLSFVLTDSP